MRSPLIMDKLSGTRARRKRGAVAEDMEDTIVLQPFTNTAADIPSTSDGTIKNKINQSALMDELDKEIDRQLKARKTELIVKYVKNLIKAAINSQYLLTSNNCKLNTNGKISQKPILTRSKIRELLAKEYNLLIPKPLQTNDPDIAELITKELPDDSSDEEYHPNDMSDDECNIIEKPKNDEDKIQSNSNINNKRVILREDNYLNNDENIGQRTRSKLCLSETPLEAIEQAFIPPDITKDMYNLECENPDWLDFLKEFTQPLNVVTQNPENIDDENDPEYNILDEEHEDLEELRMDNEVKVSKKELNALMKELWEYNQMICTDDEDDNRDENLAKKRNTKEKLVNNVKDLNDKPSTSFNLNNDNEILFNDKNEHFIQIDSNNVKEILSNDKNEDIESAIQTDLNNKNDILLSNENEILLNKQNENLVDIDSKNENEILLDKQNENLVEIDSNNQNEVIEIIIKPLVSMYKEQRLVFYQQLKQHIQMLISYYLLSYMHPMIDGKYSNEYESMIFVWENYEFIEDQSFKVFMNHVIELMKTWKEIMNDIVESEKINSFIKTEIEQVILNQKRKLLYRPELPSQIINVCKESKAFLYPLLLPSHGFIPADIKRSTLSISDNEAMLLVIVWDQYNNTICKVDVSCKLKFYEMINFLATNTTPVWSKRSLLNFIKRSLESDQPNVIKYYCANNTYPIINHYVIPLNPVMLKLKQQPFELIPEKWRTYLKKNV